MVNLPNFAENNSRAMNKETSAKNSIQGLTDAAVIESRQKYGDNVLTPPQKVSLWKLYLEKYRDPIIQILLVAAVISLALAVFPFTRTMIGITVSMGSTVVLYS